VLELHSYAGEDAAGIPLDLKLLGLLRKRDGFFVEAGAFDGLTSSNTAMLERSFGWTGALVEPSADAYELCRANRESRTYHCALVPFDHEGDEITGDFDGTLMSSVGAERLGTDTSISVPARTLQSILDELEVTEVDLFSLDTEGYELEVLNGCDFDRVAFGWLVIELYRSNFDATCTYLADRGYELVGNFSGFNPKDNPIWDGSHNDFLFASKERAAAMSQEFGRRPRRKFLGRF
jgi:FkbM family methyltransferase